MVELKQKDALDPGTMDPDEAKIRLELACNDYIREPNMEAFDFITHNGHQMSVLTFVELLQPHLTSKEDEARLNSISLLVGVSKKANLNPSEVSSIVTFLCGRLSDKYNVLPKVILGLMDLVRDRELDQSSTCRIARSLFADVDVQALHQDTRYKAYELVNALLYRQSLLLHLLEGMGVEFAVGYVNLVDGEQDPRNLVLIFQMTVTVLQHFNIDNIEETLFDVISCYYPIDFTPPANDTTVAVTPQDLRYHLNNCLKASNKLAKYVVPFLLDKFSSAIMQTRIQSCETLKQCIVSYGVGCSEEYVTRIWAAIKSEIFGALNVTLRNSCLDLVSGIFWVLTLPNVRRVDPAVFMETVFEYCKEKLEYSEAKYLKPSSLVLGAIIKSSGAGSGLVSEHCLTWLIDKFVAHQDSRLQSTILEEIVFLLEEMQCEPARANAAVVFFDWSRLQGIFLGAISENISQEMCSAGLHGISQLLNIYHLTEQEKGVLDIEKVVLGVYEHLSTVESEDGLQILTVISREYPDVVNKLLLEKLLDKVDKGEESARKMLSRLLLGNLLIEHSPRLMRLYTQGGDLEIIPLFTIALSYQDSEEAIKFCQQFIFYQFLNFVIQKTLQRTVCEQEVLSLQEFTTVLFKGRSRTVDMMVFTELFTKSAAFQPFSCDSPPEQTMLCSIYSSVLTYGSLDSTFDPIMTPLELSDQLDLAVCSSDPITVRALCQVVGLLLNRLDEGSALEQLKLRVFRSLELCQQINNRVWLCIRACQGLVHRWEKDAERAVKIFVECLTDERTHLHTANLTAHVLEPIHQGIRTILYKQRFLLTLIPLITPYVRDRTQLSAEVSSSLVKGIGTILLALPESLISTHGDTLYPIIQHNLTPETCDVATLKLVQYLLTNTPGIVVLHLDTLVSRLCNLASCQQTPVHCRAEAVRSLETCATQLHLTHTHVQRAVVLKKLHCVLGDRKRVVRQAAAETLQTWTMLQS